MISWVAAMLVLAQASSPTAPIASPPVASSSQSGGVTAYSIGSVTQVLPPVVRGPHLATFQLGFVTGSKLVRSLERGDLTDEQYKSLISNTQEWADGMYNWMKKDISEYAAERFLFRHSMSFSYSLQGNHSAEVVNMRSNTITALQELLGNLDTLMRDPSIYPMPATATVPQENSTGIVKH